MVNNNIKDNAHDVSIKAFICAWQACIKEQRTIFSGHILEYFIASVQVVDVLQEFCLISFFLQVRFLPEHG